MSTEVTRENGMKVRVNFHKTISGGWLFKWGNNEFVAWNDPAGFSHRSWNLFYIEKQVPGGIPVYFKDRVIDDNLPNRAACVDSAIEWSRFH